MIEKMQYSVTNCIQTSQNKYIQAVEDQARERRETIVEGQNGCAVEVHYCQGRQVDQYVPQRCSADGTRHKKPKEKKEFILYL